MSLRHGWFMLMGLVGAGLIAGLVDAQALIGDPCGQCGQGFSVCTCTTFCPQVETRYCPQTVTTYCDVKRVAQKTVPHCETVPVTKCHNVTVDEGCWKAVWCPKPVTKTVSHVEYQQRTGFHTECFEYTQRIPKTTTHMVPEHRIRYVPRTTQTVVPQIPCPPVQACLPPAPSCAMPCPPPVQPCFPPAQPCANPCGQPCNHGWFPGLRGLFGLTSNAAPQTVATSMPSPVILANPVPIDANDAAFPTPITTRIDAQNWTTIPTRQAKTVPTSLPAPSAAAVWRTLRAPGR